MPKTKKAAKSGKGAVTKSSGKGDSFSLKKEDFENNRKTVPGGTYFIKFTQKSQMKPARSGGGNNLNLHIQVTKGAHKGATLFDTVSAQAGWKIAQIIAALGIDMKSGTLQNLMKKCVNEELRAILREEEYNGSPQNKVVQYLPLKGGKALADDDDEDEEDEEEEDEDEEDEDLEDEDDDSDEDDDEDEEDEEEEDEDEDEDEEDDDDDDDDEEDDEDEDDDDDDDEDEDEDEEDDVAPPAPSKKTRAQRRAEAKAREAAEAAKSASKAVKKAGKDEKSSKKSKAAEAPAKKSKKSKK